MNIVSQQLQLHDDSYVNKSRLDSKCEMFIRFYCIRITVTFFHLSQQIFPNFT